MLFPVEHRDARAVRQHHRRLVPFGEHVAAGDGSFESRIGGRYRGPRRAPCAASRAAPRTGSRRSRRDVPSAGPMRPVSAAVAWSDAVNVGDSEAVSRWLSGTIRTSPPSDGWISSCQPAASRTSQRSGSGGSISSSDSFRFLIGFLRVAAGSLRFFGFGFRLSRGDEWPRSPPRSPRCPAPACRDAARGVRPASRPSPGTRP